MILSDIYIYIYICFGKYDSSQTLCYETYITTRGVYIEITQ